MGEVVDVLDGDRGINYPKEHDFFSSGHTLFLSANNVTINGFSFNNNLFISEKKSNMMGKGKVEKNDIILTSRGSVGNIAIYNSNVYHKYPNVRINSGMLILRDKFILDTKYLYQYLKSYKGKFQINREIFGSAQPQLTKKAVEQMNIMFSTIEEQTKIGEFFSKVDSLITLQQEKIEKLKELKKGYLEKLFPKHGKNIPEIRFEGFSDVWEEKKLGDIVEIGSGRDYKHLSTGDIPVYGTGGYMLSVSEALSYTDAIGIGRKGTINNPYILTAPFWTVDTLFYCIPKNSFDLNFAYNIFKKIDWKKKDESTGVPSLSKLTINNVRSFTTIFEEQTKIGTFFSNLDIQIENAESKLENLKILKKEYLRKMLI